MAAAKTKPRKSMNGKCNIIFYNSIRDPFVPKWKTFTSINAASSVLSPYDYKQVPRGYIEYKLHSAFLLLMSSPHTNIYKTVDTSMIFLHQSAP